MKVLIARDITKFHGVVPTVYILMRAIDTAEVWMNAQFTVINLHIRKKVVNMFENLEYVTYLRNYGNERTNQRKFII